MKVVVSRDGTVIPYDDCIVVELDESQLEEILDNMGDSDRFAYAAKHGGAIQTNIHGNDI